LALPEPRATASENEEWERRKNGSRTKNIVFHNERGCDETANRVIGIFGEQHRSSFSGLPELEAVRFEA
jgi:hypothetical protein